MSNESISGLGAGVMQLLSPLALQNSSGTTVFSVSSNGILSLASIETGLTAHAGGTQAAALALSASNAVHVVTIVGSAADSVKLPLATGSGMVHLVGNQTATSLQLFGSGTDTINAVATATGIAVAAAKNALCVDYAAGKWLAVVG